MQLDEVYEDLIDIVSEVGAQVDVPIESEQFFGEIVAEFNTREETLKYIQENLHKWFRWMIKPPEWLQEAEWQFSQGKPMVFVGQVEIPGEKGYFHADASFYVFLNPETGETKTFVQVA